MERMARLFNRLCRGYVMDLKQRIIRELEKDFLPNDVKADVIIALIKQAENKDENRNDR
jgi:hypothetical protein